MSENSQGAATKTTGSMPPFPTGDSTDSFLGIEAVALDQKGRVMLPKDMRDVLTHPRYGGSRRFYVNVAKRGRYMAVFAYPEMEWKRRLGESENGARLSQPMRERLSTGGAYMELDQTGRLRLTDYQIRSAQLIPRGRVAVVGVQDHIEIWDEPRYSICKEEGFKE
ncbi:MAG: hypothetical protein N3D11_08290 [Candidatus Sumerlaeia bacterium]|nr:hypothetical protein [Candidatus Sumerlaeia bacterium]